MELIKEIAAVSRIHTAPARSFRDLQGLWGRKGLAVSRDPWGLAASRGNRAARDRLGRAAPLALWGLEDPRAYAAIAVPRAIPVPWGCRAGEPGEQGEPGIQGPKGDPGDTPDITVVEDTPLSYRLQFKTTVQELTTPNLFAPFTEYHFDLSAINSTLAIPLRDLILTYQTTSSSAIRITIAPKDTAAPVLADIRRTSIYNGGTVEAQTFNNASISGRTVLDEIVYTQSQETHNIKIRQQDPSTKLWSLCEVHSFLSAGGARSSIRVQWTEYNVTYPEPTA